MWKRLSSMSKLGLSLVALSSLCNAKKVYCAGATNIPYEFRGEMEEDSRTALDNHPPTTPKEIREQVTTQIDEYSMYDKKILQ